MCGPCSASCGLTEPGAADSSHPGLPAALPGRGTCAVLRRVTRHRQHWKLFSHIQTPKAVALVVVIVWSMYRLRGQNDNITLSLVTLPTWSTACLGGDLLLLSPQPVLRVPGNLWVLHRLHCPQEPVVPVDLEQNDLCPGIQRAWSPHCLYIELGVGGGEKGRQGEHLECHRFSGTLGQSS